MKYYLIVSVEEKSFEIHKYAEGGGRQKKSRNYATEKL